MKCVNILKTEDDVLIKCLNCNRIDSASYFKIESVVLDRAVGVCDICGSKALVKLLS